MSLAETGYWDLANIFEIYFIRETAAVVKFNKCRNITTVLFYLSYACTNVTYSDTEKEITFGQKNTRPFTFLYVPSNLLKNKLYSLTLCLNKRNQSIDIPCTPCSENPAIHQDDKKHHDACIDNKHNTSPSTRPAGAGGGAGA